MPAVDSAVKSAHTTWIFALDNAARLAMHRQEPTAALAHLAAAIAAYPACTNVRLHKALTLRALGRATDAKAEIEATFELCASKTHRETLSKAFGSLG